ncbi:MAG TPA: hypothetical protein VJB58_02480 [Candidatus Paceibacterota bacterium]
MKTKKVLFPILLPLLLPLSVFAQSRDVVISSDEVAYASVFAGDLSLLLSVVIGAIATWFVFRAAKKMGGGLFGSVMDYISLGMLLMVIGTISTFFGNWFTGVWFNVVNTTCFALGYIFMVIGSNKLLKGIINT